MLKEPERTPLRISRSVKNGSTLSCQMKKILYLGKENGDSQGNSFTDCKRKCKQAQKKQLTVGKDPFAVG